MISQIVKPLVIDTPEIPIKTIIPLINNEHNHIVGYKKKNPGTIAEIDVVPHSEEQGTSVYKRIVWCLKAMMDGWQHARPVISIDGTFLKGRYRGKLLISIGVDSNNHPFPLCYGLVDEETYKNWSWFLQHIRRHVCHQKAGVCINSDCATSIISAIRDPQSGFAEQLGICMFYLLRFRSNFCHQHPGGELKKLMWKVGTTTQVLKHDAYMERIDKISPPALDYLSRIPVERWTLSHDNGVRYGQTTTNMFEGFNDNIRRARLLPVTAMMEYLFYKAVTIIDTHRNIVDDGLQQGQQLCACSAAMLAKIQRKAT
ncbi:uncharacterized protein LOC141719173 [Apium graveolens]|uniref:uncharacterized protein LOC141719173 n=1 Tax=Apium graveolens TaxID=4045 RepID=UPI003D7B8C87